MAQRQPVFRFMVDDETVFDCQLKSLQCEELTGKNKDGPRCKRKTVIGSPYCHTHLAYRHHLKIQPSTIPDAGKGLFAVDPMRSASNHVVFKKGSLIVLYHGERIDEDELVDRYQGHTAPYVVEVSPLTAKKGEREYQDGACQRCIGSIANTAMQQRQNNAILTVHRRIARLKASRDIRNNKEIFVDYMGDDSDSEGEYQMHEEGVSHSTSAR